MKNLSKIKVVGVGGSGSNAVSRMKKYKIKGVDFIVINTDAQDLKKAKADIKLRIGKEITKGLGAGMNPEIGRKAAEESQSEIEEVLKESDMVFVTGGEGGGTCTGAAPVVARIAKSSGALTLAIVTRPFSFEGAFRKKIAENGIKKIKEEVDTLIVISNDRLLETLNPNISLVSAFWICDDILRQAVQGISDLIMLPGIINIDFSDVKTIMKNAGTALLGVGISQGEKRAETAAKLAINSPLLDISCKGAKGILFNVSGSKDISLSEINEAAKIITQEINPQAKVIFGAVQDEKLKLGEIKVTVIATGF